MNEFFGNASIGNPCIGFGIGELVALSEFSLRFDTTERTKSCSLKRKKCVSGGGHSRDDKEKAAIRSAFATVW